MARANSDTPVETTEEVVKANVPAIVARKAAVDRLKALHPEEWEQILGDERESRGLSRVPVTGESTSQLLAREEKLLAKLQKLQEAKAARGIPTS